MTTNVNMKVQQGNCFKLFAICFYEPDKELFLQEGVCDNLVSLLKDFQCGESAVMMKKALVEQSDEELKVEYARLFVGPFELAAPPYGSVYLDGHRRLMGDSTLAVRKMYQDNGLTVDVMEVPDHIAVELEFMYYLYLREAEAAARNNDDEAYEFAIAQSHFMGNFLGPWMMKFCGAIRNSTESSFYRHLADCLEGFAARIPTKADLVVLGRQRDEEDHARLSP